MNKHELREWQRASINQALERLEPELMVLWSGWVTLPLPKVGTN